MQNKDQIPTLRESAKTARKDKGKAVKQSASRHSLTSCAHFITTNAFISAIFDGPFPTFQHMLALQYSN